MSICTDFHIGLEIFDKKSRNSILGSPVITSIFSCCMYKIADEIVLLSLKQASVLVNKSMDPLLWRNPCWQPHVFPVQFITRISLFCRKLFYAIIYYVTTQLTIISQEMIRICIMNWNWCDYQKSFNWWQLNLTIGSAISAWNIPISRCSIDFSWKLKLSPRQWEIIFRLT